MKSLFKKFIKIKVKNVVLFILLLLFLYIFCTPTGALKFTLFRCGYIESVINLEKDGYVVDGNNEAFEYHLNKIPFDESMGGYIDDRPWFVEKYGPFYYCSVGLG